MAAIWRGAISFGLVTIPIRVHSATSERDVQFHQVRRSDGSRVRYRRVAEADGEEVPYSEIAKGYELPTGETVVLTDEDFADLPLATQKVVDVLQFVPLEEVDPIYFAKSYYLEPDQQGAKPYVLLREALEKSGRVAIVKVALRQRETLATLRVREGVLVLETMLWPDEIREPAFPALDADIDVRPGELAMAESLIETLAGDFDPSIYSDDYREALIALIDAKVAGREVAAPAEVEESDGTVVDLMAALRASVDAARARRGEAPSASSKGAAKAAGGGAAKKAPARKSAAKATTTKAAPAKKTAAKTASQTTATKATAAKKAAPSRRARKAS